MSNPIIPDSPTGERLAALYLWMEENDCSLPRLAVMAGVSEVFMRVLLRRETIPVKRHTQLVALGMPEELLPTPIQPVMGRPRKPLLALPCAQMATA